MQKRINIANAQPSAYKAMYGLVNYLSTSQISKITRQLVKVRASQINGCALCIEMHTEESLKIGIPLEKLMLLNAWKESSFFTDEERIALAMAEEVTLIHKHGVADNTYERAVSRFGEEGVAQLIMEIVTINAWNRISVATKQEFRQHADAVKTAVR
jgi:AhpD family alkylhydroperoxidase